MASLAKFNEFLGQISEQKRSVEASLDALGEALKEKLTGFSDEALVAAYETMSLSYREGLDRAALLTRNIYRNGKKTKCKKPRRPSKDSP